MSAKIVIEFKQNGTEVSVSSVSSRVFFATKLEKYAVGFFRHLIDQQLKILKENPHHCDGEGVVQKIVKHEARP